MFVCYKKKGGEMCEWMKRRGVCSRGHVLVDGEDGG